MKKAALHAQIIRGLTYAAFVALIAFEIANYIRVLPMTVDHTWMGLIITSLAIFIALIVTDHLLRARDMEMHWAIWPLSFAMICVDSFGDILHFYSRWTWYDQIGHFLGGAAVTAMVVAILAVRRRTRPVSTMDLFFALGISTIAGNLYEIEEYFEDAVSLSNRLGDGLDTANDLLMNLLGGLFVIAVVWLLKNRRKS